jgi:hypothetical protein
MASQGLRLTLLVAVALGLWAVVGDCPSVWAGDHGKSGGGLFYNYYMPPGGSGGVPTQLYVSPRPTPPLVGHTYITYQPLMPHEFLYKHHRAYFGCNPGGGATLTRVHWR